MAARYRLTGTPQNHPQAFDIAGRTDLLHLEGGELLPDDVTEAQAATLLEFNAVERVEG